MATAVSATYAAEHTVAVTEYSVGPLGKKLGRSIIEIFDQGVRHVIVDCREWRQLDFGLLSALVKAADYSRQRGQTMELVNLPTTILADIRELRLHHRLGVAA